MSARALFRRWGAAIVLPIAVCAAGCSDDKDSAPVAPGADGADAGGETDAQADGGATDGHTDAHDATDGADPYDATDGADAQGDAPGDAPSEADGSPSSAKGHAGSELVSSGQVAKSASFNMVFSLGQPSPAQGTHRSPGYRLQGGVVGATGGVQ